MIQDILIPAALTGGLGLLFGIGLSYASNKFAVKIDERVDLVRAVLPGANCAACGHTGCDAFAEAVVEGKISASGCPVGGAEIAQRVCEILGVEAEYEEPKTARVMCKGSINVSQRKFDYSGIQDCAAASALYGGPFACTYGCAGMGDCLRACPFDAIVVEDGLARIIEYKCTSCGKCVGACPKKIIKLVPRKSNVTVTCSSLDKGATVRRNCQVGCIGCRKCSKVCPVDAIFYKGTLAEIDPEKCTNCGECIKVCPTNAINYFGCVVGSE